MAQTRVLISESLACDTAEIQGWVLGWGSRDSRVPAGGRGGEGRRCDYEEKYSPGRRKLRRKCHGAETHTKNDQRRRPRPIDWESEVR